VKNTGATAGDEVVELYLTQPKALRHLCVCLRIQRVHLGPGESAHVSLTIDPRSLGQVIGRVIARSCLVNTPSRWWCTASGGSLGSDRKFTVTGKAELPK